MGSLLHIVSQLNLERSYLRPQAVFRKIEPGEPVPLGKEGEHKWAVPHAITMVEEDEVTTATLFHGSSTPGTSPFPSDPQ